MSGSCPKLILFRFNNNDTEVQQVSLIVQGLAPHDDTCKLELFEACHTNKPKVVERLLQQGLPNPRALTVAAERGHLEVARLLIEAVANPDAATTYGKTAFISAAWHGHVDVVRLLLEARADTYAAAYGATAVMMAAEEGHLEVVRLLLEERCWRLAAQALAVFVCLGASDKVNSAVASLFLVARPGESLLLVDLVI